MKLDKLRDDIKNGQLNSMNNYIVSFRKDIFNFLFFVGCSEGCSGSSCAKGCSGDSCAQGCSGLSCSQGCSGLPCAQGCAAGACSHGCSIWGTTG